MLKTLKIAVNVAFVCAIIAYPFVLFWANNMGESAIDSAQNQNALILLAILCALSLAKFALNKDKLSLISFIFFGILIAIRLIFSGENVAILQFFYPTIINFAFLAFFAISLRGESIITKIAKMQNPALDTNGVAYTRKLTKIWCALFAFNALVGFALAFIEDKIYWSVFCGVVAYCLVGALFAVELLYRQFVLKISVRVGR